MDKTGSIVLRVFAVLVVIGVLAGGAFGAYRFGYAQGVEQSPAVAAALTEGLKDGGQLPLGRGFGMMHNYRSFPMMGGMHGGFFHFGGFFGLLIGGLLLFCLLRFAFRPCYGHHGHWHGFHHGYGEVPGNMPPTASGSQPGSPAPQAPEENK